MRHIFLFFGGIIGFKRNGNGMVCAGIGESMNCGVCVNMGDDNAMDTVLWRRVGVVIRGLF